MHRLDGPGATPGGEFSRGDPAAIPVELPSVVTADILNAFQEEYEGVLDAAGDSPSKGDNEQLVKAILSSAAASGGRLGIANLLDNGEFRIWQRRMTPAYQDSGDNPEFETTGGFGPDRWRCDTAGTAVLFLSTSDPYHVSPSSTDGEESVPFSVPLSKTLAPRVLRSYLAVGWQGSGTNRLAQRIGPVSVYSGQEMTLSVLVQSTGGAEDIRAQWVENFGSGGSSSFSSSVSTIGTTSTEEWRQLEYTFTPVGGDLIGPGSYLELRIIAPDDPSVLRFAHAFLSRGDSAAPWRPTPLALDWIHCLRYFECTESGIYLDTVGTHAGVYAFHSTLSTGNNLHVVGLGRPFLARKASTPTMSWYSSESGAVDRISFHFDVPTANLTVTSTEGTSIDYTGYPVVAFPHVSDGDGLAGAHWEADAEL